MGISMRKNQNGRNRKPHIIIFVLAIVVTILLLVVLPVEFQIKKLLFFVLIIAFSFAGVLASNLLGRK